MKRSVQVTLGLVVLTIAFTGSTSGAADGTGPTVAELMRHLGFAEHLEDGLRKGTVLSTGMPKVEQKKNELAVSAVMLVVRRPMAEVVDAYMDGEIFRLDPDLKAFKEIGTPATADEVTLASFAGIGYTSKETSEARKVTKFKHGEAFNLSAAETVSFQAIKHNDPELVNMVSEAWRTVLLDRYRDYLSEGTAGIEPYRRSRKKQVFPGKELIVATASMTLLRDHFAGFYEGILSFPEPVKGDETPVEHRFFWLETRVQNRPTFILTHHATDIDDNYAVILEQQFYVSHSYNSLEAMIGCVPFEGGTVVFYTIRTFTDQVTGFASGIARSIGRSQIQKSVTAQLEKLRTVLESRSSGG